MQQLDFAVIRSKSSWRIRAVIFCFCVSAIMSGSVANAQLIHHWKFDEPSGYFASDSAGSLNLDVIADIDDFSNKFEPGIFGNALRLTGNPDHGTNNSVPFTDDVPHSVALWVKHDPITNVSQRYLSWGVLNQGRYFFGYNNPTQTITFGTGNLGQTSWGGTRPADGEWEHWALVRETDSVTLYRNGVNQGTNSYAHQAVGISGDTPMQVGKQRFGSGEYFRGLMDDLAIWDQPLSQQQVLAAMNLGAENYNDFGLLTDSTWNVNSSGDWNEPGNWNIFKSPDGANMTATFGGITTAPRTVYTDQNVTVKSIHFASSNTVAVAGVGNVNLEADTGNSAISVSQGSHQFQSTVSLGSTADVQVADGGVLDFNNSLNLNGNNLNIGTSGSGQVNINHSVTSGGGTIFNSGTLGTAGYTSIQGDLVSTGSLMFSLGGDGEGEFDSFNVTGLADLSGQIELDVAPGFTPNVSYTLLTAGTLNAAGLSLDPSSASMFSLNTVGNSLVVTALAGLPGDFNNDGIVDGDDLQVWESSFGTPGGLDGGDFLTWQRNLGLGGSLTASQTTVPEPGGVALFLFGVLMVCGGSRRRICS